MAPKKAAPKKAAPKKAAPKKAAPKKAAPKKASDPKQKQQQNEQRGRMIELKRWTTTQHDSGWMGKLCGLKWEAATKYGEEGHVEERWLWTQPRVADKHEGKPKGKKSKDKDTPNKSGN